MALPTHLTLEIVTPERPLVQETVHEVTLPGVQGVHLAGLEAAGTACLLARALSDEVSRTAVDAGSGRLPWADGHPSASCRSLVNWSRTHWVRHR